jgi:hypothetical protein
MDLIVVASVVAAFAAASGYVLFCDRIVSSGQQTIRTSSETLDTDG